MRQIVAFISRFVYLLPLDFMPHAETSLFRSDSAKLMNGVQKLLLPVHVHASSIRFGGGTARLLPSSQHVAHLPGQMVKSDFVDQLRRWVNIGGT